MIEVFESKDGWRYRVKGGNGEILATSEAYTRQDDAERGYLDLARSVLAGVDVALSFDTEGAHFEVKVKDEANPPETV